MEQIHCSGMIEVKRPQLLNSYETGFTPLPEDVQLSILHHLTLQELLNFATTCRVHYEFLKRHQKLFSVLYYRLVYGIDLSRDAYLTQNPLHPLDASLLNHNLHDELARIPIINDLSFCTSWERLLLWQMHLDHNWKNTQAIVRLQVSPSIIQTHPLQMFDVHPQHKFWLLGERAERDYPPLRMTLHKPKTNETWVWNKPDDISWFQIQGDYVEIKLRGGLRTYWTYSNVEIHGSRIPMSQRGADPSYPSNYFDSAWSKIAGGDHPAANDEDQHCPPLKYRGYIRTQIRERYLFCPPFSMTTYFENEENVVRICHIATHECLRTLRYDCEINALDLNSKFGIVLTQIGQQSTNIDVWKTSDYSCSRVQLPPRLSCDYWRDFLYDLPTDSFVAIARSGLFLWIVHFQEFIEGQKTQEECIRYVDFSCGFGNISIFQMEVKDNRVVIALVHWFVEAFAGAPSCSYTSLLMMDMRNSCDNNNLCHEPSRIQTITLAVPWTGVPFVLDKGNVFFAAKPDFHAESHKENIRQLEKFICMEYKKRCAGGFHWQDINGNDLGCAWQYPKADNYEEFDQTTLDQIVRFARDYCPFSGRSQLNAIFAFSFTETV